MFCTSLTDHRWMTKKTSRVKNTPIHEDTSQKSLLITGMYFDNKKN